MEIISTKNAPMPGGHYSQAIVHNDMIYISGQVPVDPVTGEKILSTIENQALRVLRNIQAILEAAGSSTEKVLKVTVYISDISLWGRLNDVYAKFFGSHRPARAVVPSGELHFGFQVEMEAIAFK